MTLLILLYGQLIDFFLNVRIYRIPKEESITFPGSHCPSCNHKLSWYDIIVLFSYLSLKGKSIIFIMADFSRSLHVISLTYADEADL